MEVVFDRTAGKGAEAGASIAAVRTLTRQRQLLASSTVCSSLRAFTDTEL